MPAAILWILSVSSGIGWGQRMPAKPGELPKPPAPKEQPPATPDPLGSIKQTTGEVVSVSPAGKTLVVVTSDRKEIPFLVPSDGVTDLAQFKPGDSVSVEYTEGDGRFVARSISKG